MLLRHSALYAVARGLPGLINFLALTVYTRTLLPEEYGQYSSIVAWVALFNSLIFQWLKVGILRFLPAYQERPERFLSTVWVTFLALVASSSILWGAVYLLLPAQIPLTLLPAAVVLLWAQAWFELNLDLALAQLQPLRYGLITTMKALVALGLGAAMAFAGLGTLGVLIGLAVGFTIPALLTNWKIWRQVRLRDVDPAVFRLLLRYGLPLIGTLALGFVNSSSDRLLIKHFLGDGAVGQYAVGYDLAQNTLIVLFTMINLAAAPLTFRVYEREGEQAARAQYWRNGRLFFLLMTPAAVGLYVVARPLLRLVAGVEFQAVAPQIFTWIVVGAYMQGVKASYVDTAFHVTKNTGLQLWTVVPGAVVNILWNVAFIPRYGLVAAAHSTVVSYTLGLGLSLVLARRQTGMRVPWKDCLSAVSASLVMGWIVLVVGRVTADNLPAMIGAGVVVYGLLTIVLNAGQAKAVLRKVLGR